MFVQRLDIAFGGPDSPEELTAAFAQILSALRPLAAGRDLETLAEVVWSGLHGLATLAYSDRLRPGHREDRLDLLLGWLDPA